MRADRADRARALRWLATAAVALLAGCANLSFDVGYYLQSVSGHLALMREARPIGEVLAQQDTDPRVRAKLALVTDVRAFASRELGLPDNGSYTSYADLKRPFVLWNVFATPELSIELSKWCFPVAGCVSYRGYYAREDAERFADGLRAQGFDVYVAGVPAYSTLGWFDDPVLNTFIHYPDGELARLIFHELAHQVLYVKGDSTFNESFATAVEQVGIERWLSQRNDPQLESAYRVYDRRRQAFVALLRRQRAALAQVYASAGSDDAKRAGKRAVLAALQQDYQALKAEWGGYAGYDRWFAQQLGNAHLASVATYADLVPAFRRLIEARGGDLTAFYQASRALADLPKGERDRQLAELGGGAPQPRASSEPAAGSADGSPR